MTGVKDWTKAKSGIPSACHYRCGLMATMTEPGTLRKAHKVCADRHATGVDQTSTVVPWAGSDDRKAVPDDRALGCGDIFSKTSGRVCAGLGTQLSCQLCPESPTCPPWLVAKIREG